MDEPVKEFQLLDDEDESVPTFDPSSFESTFGSLPNNTNTNVKMNKNQNMFDNNKPQTLNNTIKIQSKSNNNSMTIGNSNILNNNKTNTNEKGKAYSQFKFNISPNRYDPEKLTKLDLKPIERPRSRPHSPLNMRGIEEYVQLYATSSNNNSNNSTSEQQNKITMNLKMDDLLSNVKNETSYQMLSDFSVLTGDTDPDFMNKNKSKRKSLDNSNLNEMRSSFKHNIDNENEDNDENEDDDDDEDDDYKDKTAEDKGNLKYKYTATYKIDEATGSFQEKSKTIFENKSDRAPPPRPQRPPAPSVKTPSSPSSQPQHGFHLPPQHEPHKHSAFHQPATHETHSVPPPPPPRHNADHSSTTHFQQQNTFENLQSPDSEIIQVNAQSQLAMALEALKNNSKKLDAKLDKIDDITPSSNSYFDTSVSLAGGESDVERQLTPTNQEPRPDSRASPQQEKQAPDNTIKKKNDTFFTEFLSKSDNLIAQTQQKLEKLSKLETVNKPLAPIPPTIPVVKPKPVPSVVAPKGSSVADSLENTSQVNQSENKTQSLNMQSASSSINNSKSLIDLKTSTFSATTSVASSTTSDAQSNSVPSNQIDLLFDINEQSFTLNTEPIKTGDSYFDLIGLSSANDLTSSNSNKIETPAIKRLPSDLQGIFDSNIIEQTNELTKSHTEFDQNFDNIDKSPSFTNEIVADEINQAEMPEVVVSSLSRSTSNQVPSIDILITEPSNEKDDNNIVPDGLFNLKHEIPYDQSRPHSPTYQQNVSDKKNTISQESFNKAFKEDNKVIVKSPISDLDLSFFMGTEPEPSTPSLPTPKLDEPQNKTTPVSSRCSSPLKSIARPRPVTPSNKPRPPSPTASAIAKSRSSSPLSNTISEEAIPEVEVGTPNEDSNKTIPIKTPINARKSKNKERVKTYNSSTANTEESSSSSEEDEKFQIRIRPKSQKGESTGDSAPIKPNFVPLLPKPPKSQQEIEEFRQRRRSSESGSITRSLKDDDSSDDDAVKLNASRTTTKNSQVETPVHPTETDRKESIHSEFDLELPDEDDSKPLTDFHDKCNLTRFSDGTYGCTVLVRQPFRNASILYKNAFQKITEVRTWTECLVKLVTTENGKKLVFFNAHELLSIATETESTVEQVIENYISNEMEKVQRKSFLDETPTVNSETKTEEAKKIEPEDETTVRKILPFHEIELKASYKFTDMCLQQFDSYTKIHTFKMQEIVFKETLQVRPDRLMALPERFIKRFTKAKVTSLLDHTPLPFEICKFAHMNYSYLRSFLLLLQDAFWQLPTITRKLQREQQLQQLQQQPASSMSITAAAASLFSFGSNKQIQTPTLTSVTSSHTREEVTVKVIDEYKSKLDKDCRIVEHKSRTRVFLITFLNSPNPFIEIGLNDCLRHGKEIVGRHDIIPIKTEQWISPEMFEINENVVDKEEFEKTHCLKCVQMPDNLLVEIMRYRTRPRRNYELPLQVRCFMSVVGKQVEVRIECTVAGTYYTKLNEVHCEDIQIRFPLPDVWVYLFRVEKMFRYGAVHSTKHKFGKIKGLDRFLVHKSSHQGALMEASCGHAKYEQAFKSLVWRIDQLPVKNKDIYKTHLFICKLQLQEYDNLPEKYDDIAQVQYSIPICAASKSQVRSVSVNECEEPPEKWVKLKSKFEYELDINYVFDQKELPTVDKENCAELQHISQTESEGDNNEDEENDD